MHFSLKSFPLSIRLHTILMMWLVCDFRHVNCQVLEHAPCSVGILVDRGFGGTSHIAASNVNSLVTVLFFGGNDDHEALAYGARMAEHPGINLIVVRFLLNPVGPATPPGSITVEIQESTSDTPTQSTDDEIIADFKKSAKSDTMKYDERVVKNGAETIDIIREYARSNLFLVGRMPEGEVVEFLKKKNECPEMGPVGNLLISPSFSTAASVLVVQQYHSQLSLLSLASLTEDETNDFGVV